VTTQLDSSVGISVPETTYGTAVVVTKFPEFTAEDFDWDPTFVQGSGLRVASRVPRAARRSLGKQMVTGDLTIEAPSKGLGALLLAALGAVVTTQRATTGVYQQNHTLAASDYLNSYTIQKGVPPLGGGAANPLTFAGMQCDSLELSCANSDILMCKTSWVGQSVVSTTGYAAPSYATPVELFTMVDAAIAIGGTVTPPTTTALATGGTAVADIVDFDCKVENALDDGGFNMGGGGKRVRKAAIGLSAVTGSLTAEYDANTLRDAYLNQTDLCLLITFLGQSVIGSGSDHAALQIYIPELRLEGELPKIGSTDGSPIQQSIDWTALDNLAAAPITIVYSSTDTAP
jgi:hypothetical protein